MSRNWHWTVSNNLVFDGGEFLPKSNQELNLDDDNDTETARAGVMQDIDIRSIPKIPAKG